MKTLEYNQDANAGFSASDCSPSGRTHLDLFSGIGGFALAARRTGWNTIALSEIEPYACKVLAKNFPGIPNLGDIRALRGIPCDLITGGFPCQPYSLAGKRRGASDDRALWPEMLRVIGESKPRWVLGENVPGIISLELDRVLADLESLGYSAWPVVLPACAADAAHRRDRVWIVAHAAQRQDNGRNGGSVDGAARCRESLHAAAHAGGEDVEHANGAGCKHGGEMHSWRGQSGEGQPTDRTTGGASSSRVETLPDDGCGRGEGTRGGIGGTTQPARWLAEPDVGRVANGIPRRMDRLRGLGNAIVPQVAAALMREMVRMENDQAQRRQPETPPRAQPKDSNVQ